MSLNCHKNLYGVTPGSEEDRNIYVANFLINGHAVVSELHKARDIFESLIDPLDGVASPYHHAPHDPAAKVRVPWMVLIVK